MIAVSTYSGECDGLALAASWCGIEVAAYCEADPKRRAQLAKRHPDKPIFESDEELTADALRAHGIHPDIIFGGPPCQPFSVAGSQGGVADSRHRWPEMRRLIHECRPRLVVVENVGGFVNLALDLVLANLEAEGYEAGAVVLPALAVGAPHRRDRCFVVGYAHGGELRKHGADWREAAGEIDQAAGAGICRLARAICEREPQPGGQLAECGRWAVDGSEGLDDANRGRHDGKHGRRANQKQPANGCEQGDFWRAAESRLGRVLDGVSTKLDAVEWPAWRGQEQHPWEPPRTVRGMKDRARRIESLGLAVVPWQAYPIFALIMEIDDILREGRR